MDDNQITAAVIFLGGESDNDWVLAAAERFPDRFIPFVSVSPEKRPFAAWWREGNVAAVVDELDQRLRGGKFRGVGELSIVHFPSVGFPETEYSPLHPITVAIMQLISEKYPLVPLMIHCEVTYIKELSELLTRFPRVNVIWAHGGYAPFFLTERMLTRHANLTIDLSMRTVEDHQRSPDYWILKAPETVWPRWITLIETFPQRFVAGTDSANRSVEYDTKKARSVSLLLRHLSPATRSFVAKKNILALVGEM